MKLDLTFEYTITKRSVKFNGRRYPVKKFLRLVELMDDYCNSETEFCRIRDNACGAGYVYALKEYKYAIWIPAEVKVIRDLLTYCNVKKDEVTSLKYINGAVPYMLMCNNYVMVIHESKTCEGIWNIDELLKAGIPETNMLVHVGPSNDDCGIKSFGKDYVKLIWHSMSLPLSSKDYTEMLSILKWYHLSEVTVGIWSVG